MSDADTPSQPPTSNSETDGPRGVKENATLTSLLKWGIVVASALAIAFMPVPQGITPGRLDVGRGAYDSASHILLCSLRLRQHHGARDSHVHALSGSRHRRRSAAHPGRADARLSFKPERIAHTLRHDTSAHLVRRKLRAPAHMVAARPDSLNTEYTDLGGDWIPLVEIFGMVVNDDAHLRCYAARTGRVDSGVRHKTEGRLFESNSRPSCPDSAPTPVT